MDLSSINLTCKQPRLLRQWMMWILSTTHGLLSEIVWNLIGLITIMYDSNPHSQRFRKVWTSGVLQSSSAAQSTLWLMLSHGVMRSISIRQLTVYRMAMHHGGATNLLTVERNQLTHLIGWRRHMNSMHETRYSYWNSNWTPQIFTAKLIMLHTWNLMQTVIGYTQTLCLHIVYLVKQ
jgi:hypothetical protein